MEDKTCLQQSNAAVLSFDFCQYSECNAICRTSIDQYFFKTPCSLLENLELHLNALNMATRKKFSAEEKNFFS